MNPVTLLAVLPLLALSMVGLDFFLCTKRFSSIRRWLILPKYRWLAVTLPFSSIATHLYLTYWAGLPGYLQPYVQAGSELGMVGVSIVSGYWLSCFREAGEHGRKFWAIVLAYCLWLCQGAFLY